ncbi:MAG: hypothetical protein KDC98_23155, partial [Planctomycetes bacterium]|nr:hypothetical protein [Planctomycetota bacterium]
ERGALPPVVALVVDADGWEWYEHADGTMSTTAMVFRSDLGRKDATSVVASPTPGVPLDPELAQQMYEEGMLGTNPGQKPTK